MATLKTAYAPSHWRARVLFDVSAGSPSPASFTFTRQDGGPCSVTAKRAIAVDGSGCSFDLALSEALIPDIAYLVTYAAVSAPFTFLRPASDPIITPADDDPEAEAFGVDLDWLDGTPTPDGDCQRRSGIACLTHDLVARTDLHKKELVQFPDDGCALPDTVNGAYLDSELSEIKATIENDWRRDDRVDRLSVDVSTDDGTDQVSYEGRVRPIATGKDLPVSG